MQIFALDPNPHIAARLLWADDKRRARKMILESCQILACCAAHYGFPVPLKKDGTPFATPKSRMNHPVIKWAYADHANTRWVMEHLRTLRSLAMHPGCPYDWVVSSLCLPVRSGHPRVFFNFAKAANKGLDFRHVSDVHEAYRMYLAAQKQG